MFPIFEQGEGRGIGHIFDGFIERFDEICQKHLADGRARSFAFILYDFRDMAFRTLLKEHDVFTKLDRLSGRNLSVFYLHSADRRTAGRFNTEFLEKLELQSGVELPCVVFFNHTEQGIKDVQVAELNSRNPVHAFQELYTAIDNYIKNPEIKIPSDFKALKIVVSSAKFIAKEAFRAALKEGFGRIF
ncbi:MAG TPA: hypothetical protein PLS22_05935 [Aquabacterium sp.]|nr:hypothetical protein [Aquabacterium sp.]